MACAVDKYSYFASRPDEEELFAKSAQNAYSQFRDKAAFSRSMTVRYYNRIHIKILCISSIIEFETFVAGRSNGGGCARQSVDWE